MDDISVQRVAAHAGVRDGSLLMTRPYAQHFLAALDTLLADKREDDVVTLNFQDVEVMDASFADEAFGTLASRHARRIGSRDCCIILSHLSPHVEETLDITLSSRPQREAGLRNCVLPIRTDQELVKLIGKCEGHVRESFDVLRENHHLVARDLASALRLDIHAASTRLKVLHDLRLAHRAEEHEGHGKQFVYTWPF